jgi:predicted transcriptional regulator
MKVTITMDDELMQRIDDYADRNYMSRSGFLSLSATQYLNTHEMIVAIKDLSICMRKIADTGVVDHDTMEQLEDFERFAKYMSENVGGM